MSDAREPTPDAYFEHWWGRGDDPWSHAGRWSEERKYRLTVAALPAPRYRRAFEPACGTGVLTRLLAERVDELVAVERHPRGAAATARRCADLPGVHAGTGTVPHHWPEGTFDLVVLSELLYYLDEDGIAAVLGRTEASLEPGGHVVAVHHRPEVAEHAWTGDEVHRLIRARPGWTPSATLVDETFVLDVFAPTGG